MKTFRNAVWLYPSSEVRNEEEIQQFCGWCARNQVGIALVYLRLEDDPSAELRKQIAQLIEACADRGIEVHGMISTLMARTGDRGTLLFQQPEYYGVDAHGISNWDEPITGKAFVYDPRHPEVVKAISTGCARLMEQFPGLCGLHLDFIRYYHYESKLVVDTAQAGHFIVLPRAGQSIRFETADGTRTTYFVDSVRNTYNDPPVGDSMTLVHSYRFCFCDDCLRDFEKHSGLNLPASLSATAEKAAWLLKQHPAEWAEFRASLITALVRSIRQAIREVGPDKQLSAAIWYNAPYGNELLGESLAPDSEFEAFGQKWWDWADAGLLDFVCPMDYWLQPDSFGEVVRDQMRKARSSIPIYAGLLRTPEFDIDLDRYAEYRQQAADSGAAGISFFHYGSWKPLI